MILKDGQRVVGEIVAERPTALYVDLGYDILQDSAGSGPAASQGRRGARRAPRTSRRALELDASGFYTSGVLKPSPVKELVSKFGEAVISIETPSGKGSGFFINKDGYAITNDHVIQGESRVSAILYVNVPGGFSRRRIEDVEIIALNPFVDLALLKLPLPADLKPSHVILGNADDVNAGDTVFAVGNPLGLERSVTQGIVSNRSRSLEGPAFPPDRHGDQSRQLGRAAVQPARRGDRRDEPWLSCRLRRQSGVCDSDLLCQGIHSSPGSLRLRQGQPEQWFSLS